MFGIFQPGIKPVLPHLAAHSRKFRPEMVHADALGRMAAETADFFHQLLAIFGLPFDRRFLKRGFGRIFGQISGNAQDGRFIHFLILGRAGVFKIENPRHLGGGAEIPGVFKPAGYPVFFQFAPDIEKAGARFPAVLEALHLVAAEAPVSLRQFTPLIELVSLGNLDHIFMAFGARGFGVIQR